MRRYLGSKKKLLQTIESFLHENVSVKKNTVFLDAFAGSGAVSEYFSQKNFKVKANDYMYFSFANLKSNFSNVNKQLMQDIISDFNSATVKYTDLEFAFISSTYSPLGSRNYFTEQNAVKIDYIRQEIERLYDQEEINEDEYFFLIATLIDAVQGISNITGTYSAFLKKWDTRALKSLTLVFKNGYSNIEANNKDVFQFVKQAKKDDVLYLDPPYTSLDYAGAYHLLETIARYDSPVVHGISGRRERTALISNFHKKNLAKFEFAKLFRNIPADVDVVLSYSSHGIVSLKEMHEAIKDSFPLTSITVQQIEFKEYKNIRTSKKGDLYEYLIHFKTHKAIKAPFNYQGSKEMLSYKIRSLLPAGEYELVEPFAGGLNFGINSGIKKIFANDLNKEVIELLKFFVDKTYKYILETIEDNIRKFNLEKNYREAFDNLRKNYNANKTPDKLLLLLLYTFNFQLRFNSSGFFNNPVGLGEYTDLKKKQIIAFSNAIKTKQIVFSNHDFRDLDYANLSKRIFYFDPPYLITVASYNDGKRGGTGWSVGLEENLLHIIANINKNNGKFILSNVIYHKGKTNWILKNWISENKFNFEEIFYKDRTEVVVWNF